MARIPGSAGRAYWLEDGNGRTIPLRLCGLGDLPQLKPAARYLEELRPIPSAWHELAAELYVYPSDDEDELQAAWDLFQDTHDD